MYVNEKKNSINLFWTALNYPELLYATVSYLYLSWATVSYLELSWSTLSYIELPLGICVVLRVVLKHVSSYVSWSLAIPPFLHRAWLSWLSQCQNGSCKTTPCCIGGYLHTIFICSIDITWLTNSTIAEL